METDINNLITSCIEQLRADGYSEPCIETHRRRWHNGIIPYMEKVGIGSFTEQTAEDYLKETLPTLAPSTKRGYTRSMHMLVEYQQTGVIRRRIVHLTEHPLDGEIGILVEKHLVCLKEGRRSPLTIDNHRRLLSYFIIGLSNKGIQRVQDLTEEEITSFIDYAQTCKREHYHAIKQFCRFLYEKGYTERDLSYVLGTHNLSGPEKLPSVYNPEEIKFIENSIEQSSAVGKRDYAIFILASRLGLRASDIAALTWNNIDWDKGLIILYQYKTRNPIELPLIKDVGEALVTYARDSRPKSPHKEVFLSAKAPYRPMTRISLNGVITRIMKSSGINLTGRRFGPHSLRHSLASNMLAKGASIPTISTVLGHESTQATMSYLRVDVVSLRECVLDVPMVSESFYTQKGGVFYD